ncbi:Uncharacterised protein [uncultured archaeon]|nr:Uncharacterised protein [uncultured archaeon]
MEGAKLNVCRDCSTSGKLVRGPQPVAHKGSDSAPIVTQEMEVVEGYGKLIESARKKMGLPLEVLAERIAEKQSFLDRVEHERTLPDEKLCHKLEKELGIKLRQPVTESVTTPIGNAKGGMTLGDILDIEMKRKKAKEKD